MTTEQTMEQRIAALERAVADIQQQLAAKPADEDWLGRMRGSFTDDPVFEEVIKYGKAFREADRPAEDGTP